MSSDRPERQPGPSSDAPVLRSLGPAYVESLHGRNAAVLLDVLTDKSATAAKNVALAGHYGSGKSSVILGVQAALDKRKIRWVNLSLSSLGIDGTERARIQQDGSPAPLTNLIQKEIVKQLLYRKPPSDMPGSRYLRIDSFRVWPAIAWGTVVAFASFAVFALLGLVNRITDMAPASVVDNQSWMAWGIVVFFSAIIGGAWVVALRTFQYRVRVESVSAGGAAVKLSAKENSYFDEYLDEIVYFFQRTKTKVAIFEDLDRFKDPHIFETLRELNTVLNNSEQIASRPVQFVYAVRDSIFEEIEQGAGFDAEAVSVPVVRESELEAAPSVNRTKFFDLVIPMVPFVTHRSARDLLAAEFAKADHQPSTALVNLVGAHLADMRVIRNIRNEYEIYHASVLGTNGLKGLTADRLFAMMVYKNLHLKDFEAIRLGTSRIDEAHRAFHAMVEHQTRHQAVRSKSAQSEADSADLWDKHARAAGERLGEIISILYPELGRGTNPILVYRSEEYQVSDLTSGDFWKSLYEYRESVRLKRPGQNSLELSFDQLVALAGSAAAELDDAVDVDVARLRGISREALEVRDFVLKSTMAQLMSRTDLLMPTEDGRERNLDSIIGDLVSPLGRKLLATGYIDENFTLYCSAFHDIAISLSAMNFILHCVQVDRSAPHFRFDEASSINAVEEEMGSRFLEGESVFNVEVFDHYLVSRPRCLDVAVAKLAVRSSNDPLFLDAYLVAGNAPRVLISRLAPCWDGVFVHLVEKAPLESDLVVALVDVAIKSASKDTSYETSGKVADFISDHYSRLQACVDAIDANGATEMMVILSHLGAQFGDLNLLGAAQRKAAISDGLYPVTRTNLSAAFDAHANLSLDAIKVANESVYRHVLANLDEYLGLLRDGEVTVERPDAFVSVLADVADVAEYALRRVAELAAGDCVVPDLAELAEGVWGEVVSAGRFEPSVWNVSQFVNSFGLNKDLVENLGKLNLTEAGEVDEEARLILGYALANSGALESEEAVRLLGQLKLPDGLDPERLDDAGLDLLPALLEEQLVPDESDTYSLVSERPFAFREEYLVASGRLASYVCELELSSDDLAKLMQNPRLTSLVKRAISNNVEFVAARLSRRTVIAFCEWAIRGNEVSVELLIALARAGAPAEFVLVLLEPHLPEIDLDQLDRILTELGDAYEPLARNGRHSPVLKDLEGTGALLEELQSRDRVSSFRQAKLPGKIRVYMRR